MVRKGVRVLVSREHSSRRRRVATRDTSKIVNRGFLTSAPMAAKEKATSDPSPCPLPEGEGSPRPSRSVPSTCSGRPSFAGIAANHTAKNVPLQVAPLGRRLPPGQGLEFGRYASDKVWTLRVGSWKCARREPSPSGRGQGEGSDVRSSLA